MHSGKLLGLNDQGFRFGPLLTPSWKSLPLPLSSRQLFDHLIARTAASHDYPRLSASQTPRSQQNHGVRTRTLPQTTLFAYRRIFLRLSKRHRPPAVNASGHRHSSSSLIKTVPSAPLSLLIRSRLSRVQYFATSRRLLQTMYSRSNLCRACASGSALMVS